VFPTPTIGMVGLVEDLSKKMTLNFKEEGDVIYLLGEIKNDIASSQYLSKICGVEQSPAPYFDLDKEYDLQQTIISLIKTIAIQSAHDVAEGGLFIALLESGFHQHLGFAINASGTDVRKDAFLFGEGQSRVIVTAKNENIAAFEESLRQSGVAFTALGTVTSGEITINGESWGEISDWKELYDTAIEKYLVKELDSEGALSMI
ncbi:MAG: phosphoribosylformylglycinamidine synthase subunit PurL, partial [Chitinophagaceae bacterium]